MLCTCIYFVDIGSFDGEEMSGPPHDLGVDPDDDHDMANAEDAHDQDEASAVERHALAHRAPIFPFARRGQPETRYRMDLGNHLCALIIDAGIRPLITETYRPMIGYFKCIEACRVTCTT